MLRLLSAQLKFVCLTIAIFFRRHMQAMPQKGVRKWICAPLYRTIVLCSNRGSECIQSAAATQRRNDAKVDFLLAKVWLSENLPLSQGNESFFCSEFFFIFLVSSRSWRSWIVFWSTVLICVLRSKYFVPISSRICLLPDKVLQSLPHPRFVFEKKWIRQHSNEFRPWFSISIQRHRSTNAAAVVRTLKPVNF